MDSMATGDDDFRFAELHRLRRQSDAFQSGATNFVNVIAATRGGAAALRAACRAGSVSPALNYVYREWLRQLDSKSRPARE